MRLSLAETMTAPQTARNTPQTLASCWNSHHAPPPHTSGISTGPIWLIARSMTTKPSNAAAGTPATRAPSVMRKPWMQAVPTTP